MLELEETDRIVRKAKTFIDVYRRNQLFELKLDVLREQQRRMRALLDEMAVEADQLRCQNEELRVANETLRATQAESRRVMDAASAANRAKDEFLAHVSHEIRTPMTAILGMTELLLETPLSEGQQRSLRIVRSASGDLLGMINGLLDYSKMEAGKLRLDPTSFSLRASVAETLRTLAAKAHHKGLELVCQVRPDVPDALLGDVGRLRQILMNLVGNAIKFTENGEVAVEIDVPAGQDFHDDGRVRFSIRDTGIGISPDKLHTIFEAYEQEHISTTRKYGGTGLGLTISSRLIALLGGELTVESELGRGTTFTFTARLERQPGLAGPALPSPAADLRDLRVLVVDDNAVNRQLLHTWLRECEADATAVGDGVAALDRLWEGVASGRPYAFLVLDASMPDTDCLTLVTRIRARSELAATRIILLTSGDRPDDLERYRDFRVDTGLLKPVPKDELVETIRSLRSRTAGEPAIARWSVAAPHPPARQQAPAAGSLRILVAEDNEFSSQLLEQLLVRRGHRVCVARTGREALRHLDTAGFDLLLLDVYMPDVDGYEVIQAIRERERASGEHLPVVAVTARSREEDRERCIASGMDEFMTKPIRAVDLWAKIDRVVVSRSLRSAL